MQIHKLLTAASLGVLIGASAAAAQPSTGLAPISSKNRTADTAAGSAVTDAGRVVVVGSGAHGGGPAPVVSGASPEARPFTSSVTDGTAKVGKGVKGTGGAISATGLTVSPSGATRGATSAPDRLGTQAKAAQRIPRGANTDLVRTGNLPATGNRAAGDALVVAGRTALVGSGAHGGGPAPVVSGTVAQTTPFTSGVTDGTAKIGKGMKATGENVSGGGVALSPSGAEHGAASAPGSLTVQAERAAAIPR